MQNHHHPPPSHTLRICFANKKQKKECEAKMTKENSLLFANAKFFIHSTNFVSCKKVPIDRTQRLFPQIQIFLITSLKKGEKICIKFIKICRLKHTPKCHRRRLQGVSFSWRSAKLFLSLSVTSTSWAISRHKKVWNRLLFNVHITYLPFLMAKNFHFSKKNLYLPN